MKTIKILPTQVRKPDGTWLGGDSIGFEGKDLEALNKDMAGLIGADAEWEQGSIGSANGKNMSSIIRMRTAEPVPIELFAKTYHADGKIIFFAYGVDKAYLGTTSWGNPASAEFTQRDVLEAFPAAKYVRFVWARNDDKAVTLDDLAANDVSIAVGTISDIRNDIKRLDNRIVEVDNRIDTELHPNYPRTYFGERINLEQGLAYKFIGKFLGQQAGCFYGDYLFRFNTDDVFKVYDMSTSTQIGGDFPLGGGLMPHCNSACFGSERYDENDEFPLVYLNAYNAVGLPKGTCYVHRIMKNGDAFYTELVQTISIGFTDDPLWTNGSTDTRPYGNFCVDDENGYLYVYTLLDTDKKTRFFKFPLPTLSQGHTVTLSKTDIIEYWDCEHFPYIQDNRYYKGKLYISSGIGGAVNNGFIRVVDVMRKQEVSRINLNSIGITLEPECIDIYDGHLVCGAANFYSFSF